jgi:hypothetical protein
MPGLIHANRTFRFTSAILAGLVFLCVPDQVWSSSLPEPKNDRQAILVGAISPSSLELIRMNGGSSARTTVVVRALYNYRNGCHGYREEYRAVVKGGGFTIANVPLCGSYAVWKVIVEPDSRQKPIIYTNATVVEGMRYWQARGQSWDDPVIILSGSVIEEESTFSVYPNPSAAQIASLFRYLADFRGGDQWLSDTTEELARQGGEFSLNEIEGMVALGRSDESLPSVPVGVEVGAIGSVMPPIEGVSASPAQSLTQAQVQDPRPTIEPLPCAMAQLRQGEPLETAVHQLEFQESVYLACRVEDLELAGVGVGKLRLLFFTLGDQYPDTEWVGSLDGLADFTCYKVHNGGEVLVCP